MCYILYIPVNNLFDFTFLLIRLSKKRATDKEWDNFFSQMMYYQEKHNSVQEIIAESYRHKQIIKHSVLFLYVL